MEQSTQQTLKRGSEGPEVEELQHTLVEHDFKPGEIDGVFGVLTESALKMFQTAANVAPDGIVGRETWQALRSGDTPEADEPDDDKHSACARRAM